MSLPIFAAAMLLRAASAPAAPPVDLLLRDVAAIDSPGNPGTLVVWGRASPLVVAPDGRIFAAATELAAGRIVAVGHGGFVGTDRADSEIFTANAIEWLAGERPATSTLRIAGLSDAAAGELARRGLPFDRVNDAPTQLDLGSLHVVIASPQAFARAGRLESLGDWVRAGGGLLVTETAWGTLQLNPDLTLQALASNRLLADAGIRFTGEAHSAFGPQGAYPVDRALNAAANASTALDVLAGDLPGDPAFAARVVGNALGNVPLDSPLIQRAMAVADAHRDRLALAYRALAGARLTPQEDPLACALLDLDSRLAAELPPRELAAHASSLAFPGPVGAGRVGAARLSINPTIPGWHTTGLYAPPGEIVTVDLPAELVGTGVTIQIGAWRDPHQHAHRLRMKNAIRRFPVETPTVEVASAIGGPIYIDLPTWADGSGPTGPLPLEIRGAAPAPHFRLGVTDVVAWRDSIRHHPAPWAELESDHVILTVPSEVVRDLDDPDVVMAHWDRVHAAMQSLEPRTANHWADRPYRYVADVSVSWGYMYCPADGPIVIPVSAAGAMVLPENFDAQGPNRLWGHYHEMGHAHQNPLWTDGATGEVTVNIFTVYALHTVNGYSLDSEVMRSDPAKAWATFEAHRHTGRRFEEVGGPFERLQFYALLWHAFGFESLRAAFDSMRNVEAAQRPRTDAEERALFLLHFSRAVGRDLSEYFSQWGIDVPPDTRNQLADLPEWLPEASATEPAPPAAR